MRVVVFCHSIVSDWNHGNAHFLRGVVSELQARGHVVRTLEPADGWSRENLIRDHGESAVLAFSAAYPNLDAELYDPAAIDLDQALTGADLVLVHEWTPPELVAAIGRHHDAHGAGVLLFHDSHHRSVTDPAAMGAYDLTHYDGVLAFGDPIRERYLERGWAARAWTWHEAADTRVFHPHADDAALPPGLEGDLVWVGNWGDEERTAELDEFLIEPARRLGVRATVFGVRYPVDAQRRLAEAGLSYGGWLPNFRVPAVFSRFAVTVHVPRRPYLEALPGIPTIRPFEALACGIPLVSARWDSTADLFTPGHDFLVARDGAEMERQIARLLTSPDERARLARQGLATIRARHTCAHRVDELLAIHASLQAEAVLS